MKRTVLCIAGLLALSGLASLASAATVPEPFEVKLLASGLSQPKGLDAVHYQAGGGPMGHDLYVAESGANRIVRIDREGTELSTYASSSPFPVGVACFAGPFSKLMYIGNAMGGGLVIIDPEGYVEPFALPGMGIAGLDFGKGRFGQYLYAGEWAAGNIWRIDTDGTPELFATCNIPGCQTRYVGFTRGGTWGTELFFTNYNSAGEIYRVDPLGQIDLFAVTGSPGLEGFDFGPGGVFGRDLYVGSISTGEIFRVMPDGTVELWASGFEGVADILFLPGNQGGFTMYIVDGHTSVFSISLK